MVKKRTRYTTQWGDAPESQVWHLEIKLHDRNVKFRTRVKFRGERGEFTFIKYVEHVNGDWIDCLDKNGQWRSIRADRLSRVLNRSARERAGVV